MLIALTRGRDAPVLSHFQIRVKAQEKEFACP
jgi:hypothetical protein